MVQTLWGEKYVTPKAKRPSSTAMSVDNVLTFIRLNPIHHSAVKAMVPHIDFLFAHTGSVDTIQKLFNMALAGKVSDFTTFTLATLVSQLGSYLANGFEWLPSLTHIQQAHLPTLGLKCPEHDVFLPRCLMAKQFQLLILVVMLPFFDVVG